MVLVSSSGQLSGLPSLPHFALASFLLLEIAHLIKKKRISFYIRLCQDTISFRISLGSVAYRSVASQSQISQELHVAIEHLKCGWSQLRYCVSRKCTSDFGDVVQKYLININTSFIISYIYYMKK